MISAKTTIKIGLEKPFTALHLSDTHICRADMRDGERKVALGERRTREFDGGVPGRTEENWRKQFAYAREHNLPILHTGDFCDFVSLANLEYMKETLFAHDTFMAVGNHEYSLYVGEAFEDLAYKMQSYDLVQSYCKNNLFFASRVIGGVNFVAIDNGYYDFTAEDLANFKAEVAKGLPIVLMLHTPLYAPNIVELMMGERVKAPCAYVVGAPKELTDTYPENRRIQQETNAQTWAFIEYLYKQPLVKAVLAGHLHYDIESELSGGIMQYVTGSGYHACAREITFV